MVRKTREEKGITLIALIITIVVLLILAVVAINAVTGDGIIQHAKNAQTGYEEAQVKENSILSDYQQYLDNKGDVGPWKQMGDIIYMTGTSGQEVELKIGDKVNYDEGTNHKTTPNASKGIGKSVEYIETNKPEIKTEEYTNEELEWRVLGITSNGKIELISTKPTEDYVFIVGKLGYLNLESNLDTFCNDLYGKGKGASSARSLDAEDINRLANYNPKNYEGYGTITTYTSGTFITEDLREVEATEENPVNFKSTIYTYTISEKINVITRDGKSMADIITKGEDCTDYIAQFLASRRTSIGNDANGYETQKYSILAISTNGAPAGGLLYTGTGLHNSKRASIRPVVTLNSDVKLSDTDNDGIWEIN